MKCMNFTLLTNHFPPHFYFSFHHSQTTIMYGAQEGRKKHFLKNVFMKVGYLQIVGHDKGHIHCKLHMNLLTHQFKPQSLYLTH